MSWDHERSTDRVAQEWKRLKKTGINIQPLTREMDLSNLSPTDARLVHGVHIYLDIANFDQLLTHELMKRDEYRRLHRYLHVVQVELRRVIQNVFDGDKIQVQGSRFHGLMFKPYDDDEALAVESLLASIVLYLVQRAALPNVFPDYPLLVPTLGIELGDCVVANVGIRGDRELISVGASANRAAKATGPHHILSIGSSLWAALPKEWQQYFKKAGLVYRLDLNEVQNLDETIFQHGVDWSIEKSVQHMCATRDSLPFDSIQSESAREKIDLQTLGPKHFKTCFGGSIFADIDGYTALIDSLLGDEEKLGKAVQLLHLFRYELRQVTESDSDGIVIQHQGDRLQALLHVPANDDEKVKRKVLELCISLNSSVEEVLNEQPDLLNKLHVAIGADCGSSVVLRFGIRGDLDTSCLGLASANAEALQIQCGGNEMRISSELRESITDDSIRQQFKEDAANNCYVATNATWTRLDDSKAAKAYAAVLPVAFNTSSRELRYNNSSAAGPEFRTLKQTRPWSE